MMEVNSSITLRVKGGRRKTSWDEATLADEVMGEVEAFFQTWLYFGTLICVFKLQGIDINETEFLITDEATGKIFVTSSKNLTGKIQAWRVGNKNDRDGEEAKMTYKILNELLTYTRLYCGTKGQEYQGNVGTSHVWPVADEIVMSMIALGYILEEARRGIFNDNRIIIKWEPSPFLKRKLLESGRCPLDTRRFLTDVGIDGHYYLTLKEFPYNKGRHSGCDEFTCRASTVTEQTYVTQHTQQGCACLHVTATEDVVKVIQNGGIPVVSLRKNTEGHDFKLNVEDAGQGIVIYVAVSHVWADGLGNPDNNSLPVCQLERIQASVDAIFPENERHPVHFWMDTLCIPVAETYKSLRKLSIKMMRQIYRCAEAVLVFDSDLQQLSLSTSVNEKSIAVYMSNWLHRLWTYQEGMLAKALYFQLKDGPLHDNDLQEAGTKEREDDEKKGIYGSFQFTARADAIGHFHILRDFIDMKLADNGHLLPILCHAIQQRARTRISDEAICVATILDTDMDEILAVEIKGVPEEVVAEKRMEVFLEQVGDFAPAIIFHHQKHMKREGYRWAPVTLMGAAQGDFSRGSDAKYSSFSGKGLRVRFPGLVFQNTPSGSGKEIIIIMKHNRHRFRLTVFPDDTDIVSLWDPAAVYVAVMFQAVSARHPIGTDVIVGTLKDPAVLREKQSRQQHAIRIDVKREYRAWLEPVGLAVPERSQFQDSVVVEMLSDKQRWRIF